MQEIVIGLDSLVGGPVIKIIEDNFTLEHRSYLYRLLVVQLCHVTVYFTFYEIMFFLQFTDQCTIHYLFHELRIALFNDLVF